MHVQKDYSPSPRLTRTAVGLIMSVCLSVSLFVWGRGALYDQGSFYNIHVTVYTVNLRTKDTLGTI